MSDKNVILTQYAYDSLPQAQRSTTSGFDGFTNEGSLVQAKRIIFDPIYGMLIEGRNLVIVDEEDYECYAWLNDVDLVSDVNAYLEREVGKVKKGPIIDEIRRRAADFQLMNDYSGLYQGYQLESALLKRGVVLSQGEFIESVMKSQNLPMGSSFQRLAGKEVNIAVQCYSDGVVSYSDAIDIAKTDIFIAIDGFDLTGIHESWRVVRIGSGEIRYLGSAVMLGDYDLSDIPDMALVRVDSEAIEYAEVVAVGLLHD